VTPAPTPAPQAAAALPRPVEPAPRLEAVPAALAETVEPLVDAGPPFVPDTFMPRIPRPLAVPGYHPASFVGPSAPGPWPRPVVVVLHGRDCHPEDECALWRRAVGDESWVLCPRGEPSERRPGEDRWTYPDAFRLREEVEAAIVALERRYPGQVASDGRTLAGFSLGANLAPWVAAQSPGLFTWLVVVEGTVRHLDAERITALREAGIEGVGLFMSVVWRIHRAAEVAPTLEEAGLRVVQLDMRGAGHAYRPDFPTIGREAMARLREPMVGLQAAASPRP